MASGNGDAHLWWILPSHTQLLWGLFSWAGSDGDDLLRCHPIPLFGVLNGFTSSRGSVEPSYGKDENHRSPDEARDGQPPGDRRCCGSIQQ